MTPEEKRDYLGYLKSSAQEVATSIPLAVVDVRIWSDLKSGVIALATLLLRIFTLCLYPISVIVLTPLLALSRVRTQRALRKAHEDFIRSLGGC